MSIDDIAVSDGDTARFPFGSGTYASRVAVIAGNAVAQAAEAIEVEGRDSPPPLNPLGLKGTGEGSAGPPPAAIANAVADALAHLGVEINEVPISREALRARERVR